MIRQHDEPQAILDRYARETTADVVLYLNAKGASTVDDAARQILHDYFYATLRSCFYAINYARKAGIE